MNEADMKKWSTLLVLTLQNAGLAMLMRYSRVSTPIDELYISSTAVVIAEVLKLILSIYICFAIECNFQWSVFSNAIQKEITIGYIDALKLLIPSGLYVFQNNLLYVASSNMPAATVQIMQQMKIITTAIMSEIILNKKHSTAQRLAVVALAFGVAIVQYSAASDTSLLVHKNQNIMTGIICVSIACITSGFAGVYFELVLKSTSTSLWIRNIEMALIGIFISLPTCLIYDEASITANGFFHGYNNIVWCVIFLSAGGGLLVALVVKYADNILKGFATSGSIISYILIYISTRNFINSSIYVWC